MNEFSGVFMGHIDKMHTGELYLPTDEKLFAEQKQCLKLLYEFNMTSPADSE